ncbi:MAG TPA: four helix bundle protein [Terriglobia bacterium]|nr:four helix bundle protein [Terriglobia bacterium]
MENSEESVQKSTLKSYRDLRVWNEAMTLAEGCYLLTRGFPKYELYGMTAQIRRAAASVPANIAEAYGCEGRGQYIQFLRVAQGSLKELETHVLLSQRVGLSPGTASDPVLDQCEAVGRSLQRKGA